MADSSVLINAAKNYKTEVDEYNTAIGTYNTARDVYDKAVKGETDRRADFFKASLDAPIVIPTRPNMPSQPREFNGPRINISTTAWAATYALQGDKAYLSADSGTTVAATLAHSTRNNFLSSSPDTA